MCQYRNSSLTFIYSMIFPVFFGIFLFKANVEKQICFGLGISYCSLVISVVVPVLKKRKEIKEIQKNGRCYVGNIEKLIEIEVGTTYNRFGHKEYDNAYYLKVIPEEEIFAKPFVYSDVLVGKKGQNISNKVLIYDWYGKTFVVCTDVKTKQNYKVEQTKEVMQYSCNRRWLIFINRLIAIIDVLFIIVEVLFIMF